MFGSYYAVNGFGAVPSARRRHAPLMSRPGRPASTVRLMQAAAAGLGATASTFDAASIWKDQVAGSPVASGGAGNNAAGKRAALATQAALSKLGYDTNGVDGVWGKDSEAAYTAFAAANGATNNAGYPTQDGLQKIEDLLNAGVTPGPNPVVYEQHDGQYVTVTPSGSKQAALTPGLMIAGGAVAAIVLVGLVLAGKKKPEGGRATASKATPNPRRKRRHATRRDPYTKAAILAKRMYSAGKISHAQYVRMLDAIERRSFL